MDRMELEKDQGSNRRKKTEGPNGDFELRSEVAETVEV